MEAPGKPTGELRMQTSQIVAFTIVAVVMALVIGGLLNYYVGFSVAPFIPAFAVAVVIPIQLRRWFTGLSLDGIETNAGRSFKARWSDISEIEVHTRLSGRHIRLVANGKAIRLPIPVTSSLPLFQDPDFDNKVAGIRDWWNANRSPSRDRG